MSYPIITRQTTTFRFWQGADLAKAEELEAAAEAVKPPGAAASQLMVDQAEWMHRAAEYEEFVKAAGDRRVTVVLEALDPSACEELCEAHPPRPDHAGDEAVGVNEAAFRRVLVPRSLVEPECATDEDREGFIRQLTSKQLDELYMGAWLLNRGTASDPKASLVSEPTHSDDETSK